MTYYPPPHALDRYGRRLEIKNRAAWNAENVTRDEWQRNGDSDVERFMRNANVSVLHIRNSALIGTEDRWILPAELVVRVPAAASLSGQACPLPDYLLAASVSPYRPCRCINRVAMVRDQPRTQWMNGTNGTRHAWRMMGCAASTLAGMPQREGGS